MHMHSPSNALGAGPSSPRLIDLREERAHLLEEAVRVALALLVRLIDLVRHELLHLTHCSSRGDLNAGEGRGQLLLRLGELGLLLGEVELELLLLILDLGHLLLQLLGVGICKQPSQQHHKEWREGERQRGMRERGRACELHE